MRAISILTKYGIENNNAENCSNANIRPGGGNFRKKNEFSKKVPTIATKIYNEDIYVTNFYRNEFKFIFKYVIQK